MYVAIRRARVNDKFQDSLYLFLELVRAGVMHGNLWSGRAFSGGPSFGTGTYHSNNFVLFSTNTLSSHAIFQRERRKGERNSVLSERLFCTSFPCCSVLKR